MTVRKAAVRYFLVGMCATLFWIGFMVFFVWAVLLAGGFIDSVAP